MRGMALVLPQDALHKKVASCRTSACQRQQRWNSVALLSFAGGFIGNVLGLFLTLLNGLWRGGAESHFFGSVGTALLLISLPLIVLGGHALDKATEAGKEYDRRTRSGS